MRAPLTRQQRRQMQRLAEEADRAVEGDRRFFDRWPIPEIIRWRPPPYWRPIPRVVGLEAAE